METNSPFLPITILGGGLAGSEAAYQLASRGIPVRLYEMRPKKMTEAHLTGQFAELVCSNSFGAISENHASKILKDEMQILGAFVLRNAFMSKVPAGASLAVDREIFSNKISETLRSLPSLEIISEEIDHIPEKGTVIIATGPLTTPSLSRNICELVGQESLYFYDAISPIVSFESLDLSKMYFANRYDKGDTADFLNIPLTKEQYDTLLQDLLTGDVVLPHDFEKEKYFEGCMPIEVIASRGPRTLAFGTFRPVGLDDPKTGRRPYAVIQLRTENEFKTAYNLVGFQTKLKYNEQLRIFRKLPGLENAEFLRLGSMHRNTFLDSPRLLTSTLQLQKDPRILIAGQLTGTEGYLEASATGLFASLNVLRLLEGKKPRPLPRTTMLGSLMATITDVSKKNFQPMNANYGILPPIEVPVKDKKLRNELFAKRSLDALNDWLDEVELAPNETVLELPADYRV